MTLFLVFAYDQYYPAGGWNDFESAHITMESAEKAASELRKTHDWVDIIDLKEDLVKS